MARSDEELTTDNFVQNYDFFLNRLIKLTIWKSFDENVNKWKSTGIFFEDQNTNILCGIT